MKGRALSPLDDRPSLRERYRGALLGVAVGDAFGAGVTYNCPNRVRDLVGGGPFHLRPGEWTDDTALTLCTAESLIEAEGFDPISHLDYLLAWLDEGYNSCRPYAFDIGGTILRALTSYRKTGLPSPVPTGSGNGSLMRVAPIALYYANDAARASDIAASMSQTTHGAIEATDACRYWTGLLVGAIMGVPKTTLLRPFYHPDPTYYTRAPLCPKISKIAGESFAMAKKLPDIATNGYVVSSLHVALWAFAISDSFVEGLLRAVHVGGDTDSIGAIYGALAGVYYGADAIPQRWRCMIARRQTIESFAKYLATSAN